MICGWNQNGDKIYCTIRVNLVLQVVADTLMKHLITPEWIDYVAKVLCYKVIPQKLNQNGMASIKYQLAYWLLLDVQPFTD